MSNVVLCARAVSVYKRNKNALLFKAYILVRRKGLKLSCHVQKANQGKGYGGLGLELQFK